MGNSSSCRAAHGWPLLISSIKKSRIKNSFLKFFFLLTSPEAGHLSLGRLGHQEHSGSLICVSSEDHKSLILSRQKRMKELWGRDHRLKMKSSPSETHESQWMEKDKHYAFILSHIQNWRGKNEKKKKVDISVLKHEHFISKHNIAWIC